MATRNGDPDFSGKCISMNLIDDDTSHDLVEPHFETQGGRLFIVGTVPQGATESDWIAGRQACVAWDRVAEYFVFDSLKQFSAALKKSEAAKKMKRKKN